MTLRLVTSGPISVTPNIYNFMYIVVIDHDCIAIECFIDYCSCYFFPSKFHIVIQIGEKIIL